MVDAPLRRKFTFPPFIFAPNLRSVYAPQDRNGKQDKGILQQTAVHTRSSFSDRERDFVLDYCEANGMAFLPWGPMAQGRKAIEVMEKIAAARQASTAVVSLAWLLRRSPVVLPIPGACSVKHLEENVNAAAFRLTGAEFAELAAVVPKPYWLRG